jgi:hypothetical protein
MQKRQTNVVSPVRWSLISAATEFVVDRKTLQKKLIDAELLPGDDGLYSTKQVMDALTGDMKQQRLRLVKAMAENGELKNQKHKGELLKATDVLECLSKTFHVIKQEITSSPLPPDTIRSILSHLSDIDVTTL